ncbi:MAG: ribonuclease P protein component [Candidatus Dojkabacteria bacterium]
MLPKKYRLLAKEFPYTYQKGTKLRGKYGMLVYVKSNNPTPRFGFVVSKKVGNAVQRHRFTRLLRSIFIEAIEHFNIENLSTNYQYISFEFCNEREILKEDLFNLMEKSIKG